MENPQAPQPAPEPMLREVRFEHSREFPELLRQLSVTLLVSTYQAGKLVVLGADAQQLKLSFHNFEQAMGVAIHPQQIAVGGRTKVWFLKAAPGILAQLPADAEHDAYYLTRGCHVTDEIHIHEMAWCGDELWLVNTRFSCLCTVDGDHSFVPRWQPPFITSLAPEDRCHLNGLAVHDGRPALVTAMAMTDTAQGWRPNKATTGCLLDVATGGVVSTGLAMPHSPRLYGDRIWVLDSGRGQLVTVDPRTGQRATVTAQPGYTRGLDFAERFAFVGLSKIRETSTFGGVPIAEKIDSLKCGIAVIDLVTGRHVAHFEFVAGVEEIFDVRVLANVRNPCLAGPQAISEGGENIWYVPSFEKSPSQTRSSDSATSESPGLAEERYQRGLAFADADRFEEAVTCFREAIELQPNHVDALWNLGTALQFSGHLDESIAALRRAIEIQPELPAAHMNLAMSLFLSGDFAAAWSEYEWRWRTARFSKRPQAAVKLASVWEGQPLHGKSILVYGEQGVGDEIMFASVLPELIANCRQCTIACDSRLVPLLQRSFPRTTVIASEELTSQDGLKSLAALDFQIAAGSVFQHIRPNMEITEAPAAFLVPDPDQVAEWRRKLSNASAAKRVGISWRGGSSAAEIGRRSINPQEWGAILQTPGVEFINLQYAPAPEDLQRFDELAEGHFNHFSELDPVQDLDAFAALVASLDLVISVDNTTVHVAGALGVPTWVLLSFPSASYWRWSSSGEQSAWYQSAQLFRRQPTESNWNGVLGRVQAELAKRAEAG